MVGGQQHAPAALPPGKTRYPLYRRLGGPQGWSWRVWKISPPPGFNPRIVHPVASRYTDWAISAAVASVDKSYSESHLSAQQLSSFFYNTLPIGQILSQIN